MGIPSPQPYSLGLPLISMGKEFFPIPGLYYQVWIWVMGMGINDNGTMLIGLPVFF
jgi:hypothetical protein